jgi:hypothetical protein
VLGRARPRALAARKPIEDSGDLGAPEPSETTELEPRWRNDDDGGRTRHTVLLDEARRFGRLGRRPIHDYTNRSIAGVNGCCSLGVGEYLSLESATRGAVWVREVDEGGSCCALDCWVAVE